MGKHYVTVTPMKVMKGYAEVAVWRRRWFSHDELVVVGYRKRDEVTPTYVQGCIDMGAFQDEDGVYKRPNSRDGVERYIETQFDQVQRVAVNSRGNPVPRVVGYSNPPIPGDRFLEEIEKWSHGNVNHDLRLQAVIYRPDRKVGTKRYG